MSGEQELKLSIRCEAADIVGTLAAALVMAENVGRKDPLISIAFLGVPAFLLRMGATHEELSRARSLSCSINDERLFQRLTVFIEAWQKMGQVPDLIEVLKRFVAIRNINHAIRLELERASTRLTAARC